MSTRPSRRDYSRCFAWRISKKTLISREARRLGPPAWPHHTLHYEPTALLRQPQSAVMDSQIGAIRRKGHPGAETAGYNIPDASGSANSNRAAYFDAAAGCNGSASGTTSAAPSSKAAGYGYAGANRNPPEPPTPPPPATPKIPKNPVTPAHCAIVHPYPILASIGFNHHP